jgi:hypothetical protein
LYIYAQEHTNMGYRQGMHEIASYLMFVLELEEPGHVGNILFTPRPAICFAMLEAALEQLQTAYDASGNQSLQKMSHSILSKLHQNDQALYNYFTGNPNIPVSMMMLLAAFVLIPHFLLCAHDVHYPSTIPSHHQSIVLDGSGFAFHEKL